MKQAIEELAEKRRKWVDANRENGFETGIKRLLTDLYPDNAHFIYELLQNAEDAYAEEVRFILQEDCIEFEHDGKRLFSIPDVDAITSIGFSTKRDDSTNIGKFGVGFKAVFSYTNTPEINSGDIHFRIRDLVIPEPENQLQRVKKDGKTRFTLPFDNPNKPPIKARSEIEKLLKALDEATLLFLFNIRKIEYLLPDLSLGCIQRKDHADNRIEIRVQRPDEAVPDSTWFLKFNKEVLVKDTENENEDPRSISCLIGLAFGLSPVEGKASSKRNKNDKSNKATSTWDLVPIEPGRVCIYFPAEKETSNLRFHLHAPFASTVARDSVRECVGNDILRDHLAELLAESMLVIRDQGLLNTRFLAVLPNDRDNLSGFYQPLMNRLVEEFQQQDLVPMKNGGHAAASGVFRGNRTLSDLIDDADLVTLLREDYTTPMWIANPPQRNQREDNFLSLLEIKELTSEDIVSVLSEMDDSSIAGWMGLKPNAWHYSLYSLFTEYAWELQGVKMIRTSDGKYCEGNECYFPTDEIEHDQQFPRVTKQVYYTGKDSDAKVIEFLKGIGVREVDEQVEIGEILKAKYAYESEPPYRKDHYSHLKRFIRFWEESPLLHGHLFRKAYLFMIDGEEGIEWATPGMVYLDVPYMDTSLRFYYEVVVGEAQKWPLSRIYEKSGINAKKIGEFAKSIGASTGMEIKSMRISSEHPEWPRLNRLGGERYTGTGKNKDYCILNLEEFLKSPSINKSKLIWQTMKENCSSSYVSTSVYYDHYLRAFFGRNGSNIVSGKSTLVYDLKNAKWIPQQNGNKSVFVQPCDAVAEKLPEGFEYQTGWEWLQELEFGERVEERRDAQRRAEEQQTKEYKNKETIIRDIGFESPEKAEEIARFVKEHPLEFEQLQEKIEIQKEESAFPTRFVPNPEQRQERLIEQLSESPDKDYKKRERRVRTTNGFIDPITWLRNQYTKEDDQMFCQICKNGMPFRKRNGFHYFEKKEVLSRKYLSKEHEAQYLALCPVCAAKYDEFVKTDDVVMAKLREEIIASEDCEIPIALGDEETSIRFVETHYRDLKTIVEESFDYN